MPFLFVACSQNPIEEAAMAYIKATSEYDIEAAMQYATPETQTQTLAVIRDRIMPNLDSTYIERNMPVELSVKSIQQLSDTEAVVYYFKKTHINQFDGELRMRLRDGEWKAHILMDKTNPFFSTALGKRPESTLPDRRQFDPSKLRKNIPADTL